MKEKKSKYEQLRTEVEDMFHVCLDEHNRTSSDSVEYLLALEKMAVTALILTRMLELDEIMKESE